MKEAKEDVNYGRGMRESHCGKMDQADSGWCKHFIERGQPQGLCEEVEGRIGRSMWCERWERGTP